MSLIPIAPFCENTVTHLICKTKQPSLSLPKPNCFAQNGRHESDRDVPKMRLTSNDRNLRAFRKIDDCVALE
jgi:hypothetical protein